MVETTDNDGLRIAYERVGEQSGEPLLLIMGHLGQMVGWPAGFCAELTERGLRVARFDNRDAGLSSRFNAAPPQSRIRQLLRPQVAYRLDDMAGDAVAVLDALGWESAHLVGISMGGMIAQRLGVSHPARVRSLTSIMSTPSPRIGKVRRRTLLAMIRVARQHGRPTSTADAVAAAVDFSRITGSPGFPVDIETLTATVRDSLARDPDPFGTDAMAAGARQRAAIRSSGDRRAELAGITAPALVIHGDRDVLIRPAGGRATAAAIPAARLVRYPGMGHDLPRALWPAIADEIAGIAGTLPVHSAGHTTANRPPEPGPKRGGVHAG